MVDTREIREFGIARISLKLGTHAQRLDLKCMHSIRNVNCLIMVPFSL